MESGVETPPLDAMTDFKNIDKDGIWVKNVCMFPMADGSTQNVFFPAQPTKVAESDWLKIQLDAGVLAPCDNPLAGMQEEEAKPKRKGKEEA